MTLTPQRSRTPLTLRRTVIIVTTLAVILAASVVVSISSGSVDVTLPEILAACTGSGHIPEAHRIIIVDIRLPRVLMAVIVGSGLAIAGLVFQALLRNPLAEPYILGISSGGTVGALLAMGLALGPFLTPLASFAGSGCVMALVYMLAQKRGRIDTHTLLLSGVMIGAFFNAAILIIIALFNQELRNAFLWLMGNLGNASIGTLAVVGPIVAVASLGLLWYSKSYNLISTGDETALQLGVDVGRVKRISYVLASLITGAVVSVSGVVGFVGLIVPHACRLMFGPDHRLLVPASILVGAAFLVLTDLLARTLFAPLEIPVGAVTAALGAPVFIYLLKKN